MACKVSNEDHCSPERLFTSEAAKDPYSTDEEQQPKTKLRRLEKTDNKKSNPNMTGISLNRINNGSEFKGEQSYFYQNILFQKIGEEIPLEDKSICECLEYIFEFSSSEFFNEQNCTWKGETIIDMFDREIKSPRFKRFAENDDIDWKTASEERKLEFQKLHVELKSSKRLQYNSCAAFLNVAEKIKTLYDNLQSENMMASREERCDRHNSVRRCIESIATFIDPINYLRNGDCEANDEFYVPEALVSDTSPLIPEGRKVYIKSQPDGVFTVPYTRLNGSMLTKLWFIPVQIYGLDSDKEVEHHQFSPHCQFSPKSKPEVLYPPHNKEICKKKSSNGHNQTFGYLEAISSSQIIKNNEVSSPSHSCLPKTSKDILLASRIKDSVQRNEDITFPKDCYLPPNTFKDGLLDSSYVNDVRNYITEALPVQCRSSDCLNKMTGEHVQQLLASARHISCVQTTLFDPGVLHILGFFIMKEYVYFSRLDIPKKVMYYHMGIPYKTARDQESRREEYNSFKCLKKPVVSYSNFRLDLTIAKHRLAFMMFIENYQKSFFNTIL